MTSEQQVLHISVHVCRHVTCTHSVYKPELRLYYDIIQQEW